MVDGYDHHGHHYLRTPVPDDRNIECLVLPGVGLYHPELEGKYAWDYNIIHTPLILAKYIIEL